MFTTQHALRRRTTLFAVLLIVVHFMIFLYLRDSSSSITQYQLQLEMVLRVTYISAIANMLTFQQLDILDVFATVTDNSPFLLTAYKADESPVKVSSILMEGSNDSFPVYLYNPDLDAVFGLRLDEPTPTTTGCTEEFLSVTMCMALVIPLVLLTTLGIANLVARGGYPTLAKVVVWVGYVAVPCGLSVGFVYTQVYVQNANRMYDWLQDIRRSSQLYASTFDAMKDMLVGSTADVLASTLASVNERVYDEHKYQVVLAKGKAKTIMPPLKSRAVEDALFARADRDHVELAGRVDGYTYAGESVPSISSLLIVVRKDLEPPRLLDAQHLPALLMLVGTTVFLGIILLLLFFPFEALGHRGATPHNVSPWENRLTPYWPYAKLLEMVVLITVVVMVLCLSLNRMSMMFHRVEVLRTGFLERNDKVQNLQEVSDLFAECYSGVLRGSDWTLGYVDKSTQSIPYEANILLGGFYAKLLEMLQRQQLVMCSVVDALSSEAPDNWPLLSNVDEIHDAQGDLDDSMEGMQFQHYLMRSDGLFYRGVLSANSALLVGGGSEEIVKQLMKTADLVDIASLTPELLQAALVNIESSMEVYRNIAQAYAAQRVNSSSIKQLYQTTEGGWALKIESYVLSKEQDRVPRSSYLALTYGWGSSFSLSVLYAVLAAVLFALVFDLLYSASFFGGVPTAWLWMVAFTMPLEMSATDGEGTVAVMHRHDYTAPRKRVAVDVHAIRSAVRYLLWCVFALLTWTLVMVIIFHQDALHSMAEVLAEVKYSQVYITPLTRSTKQSAVIEMSLAAWARAYLSQQDSAVNEAIDLTSLWTNMKPISWEDMAASHDPSRLSSSLTRSLLALARNVSTYTSLIRSGEWRVDASYADFVALLNQYDDHVHFQGYEACLDLVLPSWEMQSNAFLKCLVADGPVKCYTTPISALVGMGRMCGTAFDPDAMSLYLHRLQYMRRLAADSTMSYSELADMLSSATTTADTQIHQLLDRLRLRFSDMSSSDSLRTPWIVMVFVWVSAPLVYLTYVYSRQLHNALYYN